MESRHVQTSGPSPATVRSLRTATVRLPARLRRFPISAEHTPVVAVLLPGKCAFLFPPAGGEPVLGIILHSIWLQQCGTAAQRLNPRSTVALGALFEDGWNP